MTDVLIPEERPLDELLVKVREKQTLPNVLYSETYVYKPIELQIAQLLTEFPMLKMKSVNVRQIRKRHFP